MLHSKELHALYKSSIVSRLWAGHAAMMGDALNASTILMGKLAVKHMRFEVCEDVSGDLLPGL
jgi:hypothetical protein